MKKELICIECPKGCSLEVEVKGARVVSVKGNDCPKGNIYAVSEIENPERVLTSTVRAEGLDLKMVPVRTNNPIPKDQIFKAMELIRKIVIDRPVRIGEVIDSDFMGLRVKLIVIRKAQVSGEVVVRRNYLKKD